MWIGTLGGLVRFDLSETSSDNYKVFEKLSGNTVNAILVDNSNEKWIGTVNGLYRYNNAVWKEYTTDDGLGNNNVTALTMDDNWNLYVGTAAGLDIFDGQNWIKNTLTNRMVKLYVTSMLLTPDDLFWVTATAGVYLDDGVHVTLYTRSEGLAGPNAKATTTDRFGTVWALTDNGVSQFITRSWWRYFTMEHGFPQSPEGFRGDLAFDEEGNLWAANTGVSKFDGADWMHYDKSSGLAGDIVSSIVIEDSGVKWFGTDKGLSRFDDASWTTYRTGDFTGREYFDEPAKRIVVDYDGRVWAASDNGLNIYDGSTWAPAPADAALDFTRISAMAVDSSGIVWVGTEEGGLGAYAGSAWTIHVQPEDSPVLEILTDRQRRVWVAVEEGVAVNDGAGWEFFASYNANFEHKITSLSLDENDCIWAGDTESLYKYDGAGWTNVIPFEGVKDVNVRSIAVANDTLIWIGTESDGLVKYNGKTWKSHSPITGFPTANINDIRLDHDNMLWVATQDIGLLKYFGVWGISYAMKEGLSSPDVRSIFVDNRNNKWLGMSNGITVFGTEMENLGRKSGMFEAATAANIERDFAFHQNYPNPFNSLTTIRLDVNVSVRGKIVVYNVAGQRIRVLGDQMMPPGTYYFTWDGTNSAGMPVSSGIYIYQLQAGIHSRSGKMVLIR